MPTYKLYDNNGFFLHTSAKSLDRAVVLAEAVSGPCVVCEIYFDKFTRISPIRKRVERKKEVYFNTIYRNYNRKNHE